MPIGIIILAAATLDRTTIMIIAAFLLFCKYCTYRWKGPLELHYDKKNKLFQEFIKTTNIAKMEYEPYILAANNIM